MRVRENKGFFQFVNGILTTYGFMVMVFIPFVLVLGESARGFSSFFSFGGKALNISTLIELLILAVVINIFSSILFTDKWIRNMPIVVRSILFFTIITLTIVIFVYLFHWFPINYVEAWIGFFLSFGISSTLGVIVSRLREKSENERMNKALEEYMKDHN